MTEDSVEILAQIPLARLGTVDEVAAAASLASDEATYITGHVLAVNGSMYGRMHLVIG